MKRYNLSAEFVRWEAHANLDEQVDSFEYVVEVDSEEEAQQRLETLVIERMASRPGWTYKLISSHCSEFESSSTALSGLDLLPDAIRLNQEATIENTLVSDTIRLKEEPSMENSPEASINPEQSAQSTEAIEELA